MKKIWFFKFLNDDYYGRPISGISELYNDVYISIKHQDIYHNVSEIFYKLSDGREISNLKWYIFDNENDAIEKYNKSINLQIKQCDEHIDKLINIKQILQQQLIKTK